VNLKLCLSLLARLPAHNSPFFPALKSDTLVVLSPHRKLLTKEDCTDLSLVPVRSDSTRILHFSPSAPRAGSRAQAAASFPAGRSHEMTASPAACRFGHHQQFWDIGDLHAKT